MLGWRWCQVFFCWPDLSTFFGENHGGTQNKSNEKLGDLNLSSKPWVVTQLDGFYFKKTDCCSRMNPSPCLVHSIFIKSIGQTFWEVDPVQPRILLMQALKLTARLPLVGDGSGANLLLFLGWLTHEFHPACVFFIILRTKETHSTTKQIPWGKSKDNKIKAEFLRPPLWSHETLTSPWVQTGSILLVCYFPLRNKNNKHHFGSILLMEFVGSLTFNKISQWPSGQTTLCRSLGRLAINTPQRFRLFGVPSETTHSLKNTPKDHKKQVTGRDHKISAKKRHCSCYFSMAYRDSHIGLFLAPDWTG